MPSDTVFLFYDNNSAIALAKEPRSYQKSKYIERWFYIICDYLKKGYIKVKRVDTVDYVVDPLRSNWVNKRLKPFLRRSDLDL